MCSLLQSLDHLPDPPPPIMDSPDPLPPPIMDPPSSDIHPPTIDLSKAIADVTKCFMPVQGQSLTVVKVIMKPNVFVSADPFL